MCCGPETAYRCFSGHSVDMAEPTKLTDAIVKRLSAPESGNEITKDISVRGFGVRVTAAGHRAFVLTYYNRAGRQRRYTIGIVSGLVGHRRPR